MPMVVASLMAMGAVSNAAPLSPPIVIPGSYRADRQPDGNSVIFEGNDGLILFDTGRHPDHQQQILAYASSRRKPIVAIVNSHWHLDHTGGNQEIRQVYPAAALYASDAVADALTTFFARNAAKRQQRLADPTIPESAKTDMRLDAAAIADVKDLLPDVPVLRNTSVTLAGRQLDLHLASKAATKADVWVYDRSSRTVAAGDLVVLPAPFFDTACPRGWQAALRELGRVRFRTLIPGHGPAMNRTQFRRYRIAFDTLVTCSESKAPKIRCMEGWKRNAAVFLNGESDRKDADELLDYYFEAILRSPAKIAELCGS